MCTIKVCLTHRYSVLVNQLRIMGNKVVFLQIAHHNFNLARMPYIVLITKKDIISVCMVQCVFKISYIAMVAIIKKQFDARITIGSDNITSIITTAIIRNHQLVTISQLRKYRVYLFFNILFTIVSGHTDTYHRIIHF